MSEEGAFPPLADGEMLARFVLFNRWIRAGDQTIKPDAFTPYPHQELSVTRHLGLTETELWDIGRHIAQSRPATLYGRADIAVRAVSGQKLGVVPTATPRNHANIVGWPAEKSAQKIIALELAAAAIYVPNLNIRGGATNEAR